MLTIKAHCIKDSSTLTTRAAQGLRAHSRWAVTGTPIQERPSWLCQLVPVSQSIFLFRSKSFWLRHHPGLERKREWCGNKATQNAPELHHATDIPVRNPITTTTRPEKIPRVHSPRERRIWESPKRYYQFCLFMSCHRVYLVETHTSMLSNISILWGCCAILV